MACGPRGPLGDGCGPAFHSLSGLYKPFSNEGSQWHVRFLAIRVGSAPGPNSPWMVWAFFPQYKLILRAGFSSFGESLGDIYHIYLQWWCRVFPQQDPASSSVNGLWIWDGAVSLRTDLDLENEWVLVIFHCGDWHVFCLPDFNFRLYSVDKTLVGCPSISFPWSISNCHRSLWDLCHSGHPVHFNNYIHSFCKDKIASAISESYQFR